MTRESVVAEKFMEMAERALLENERLKAGLVKIRDDINQLLREPTKKPRDLNVARVDEHGVAYNAAGESIGITGTMGPSCNLDIKDER